MILIFKSETTKAVYSFNGNETVTIIGAKGRPVGKIMKGFENNQLEYVFKNKLLQFWVGESHYIALAHI